MLTYNKAIYGKREEKAVLRVLKSDYLSGGYETAKFEEELAKWWGIKYAVATNSGSTANLIALQALNLPKGSEVITPAGGAFPTTIAPILYLGLKPVFVDINLTTFCIDSYKIEVNSTTKAIMFAHTLGRMPEMSNIRALAKSINIPIIEDCADSMGSEQNGKKAGAFGDIATVSFYPAHLMTTGGEGGAVLTNDKQLYMRSRSIRDWGRACYCRPGHSIPACGNRFGNPPFDHRYFYTNLGLNFKMTEMQAAFGREQLKRIDKFIEKRKRNYSILAKQLDYPKQNDGIVPFCFPILNRNKQRIIKYLRKKGVDTRPIFSGNILKHPAYKIIDCQVIGNLENSDKVLQEGFFVGVGPHLTKENMYYIANLLLEYF